MKKNVMIRICTRRVGVSASLFEEALPEEFLEDMAEEEDEAEEEAAPPSPADAEEGGEEETEMLMEGRLLCTPHRIELVYEESELTGMEGSVSTVGFDPDHPGLVSMLRSGPVSTALVFEEGRRHTCVYDTPFSSFDVCVATKKVVNELLTEGRLELDYIVEIHGAQAERCRMTLTVQ